MRQRLAEEVGLAPADFRVIVVMASNRLGADALEALLQALQVVVGGGPSA
jgi:hypothetical protein